VVRQYSGGVFESIKSLPRFNFVLLLTLLEVETRCKPSRPLVRLTNTPPGVLLVYNMKTTKDKIIRRLKIIEGQVRGVQKMVEKDTYCIDVITQTSAAKQGLSNLEDLLLERHLGSCVLNQVKSGQADKAKKEILKVYKLKRV